MHPFGLSQVKIGLSYSPNPESEPISARPNVQPRSGTAMRPGRYGALRQQLRARRWWDPDLRPNLASLQALRRQPERT